MEMTDEMLNAGVPAVEVYPVCEHRFEPIENPDGSKFCWICGEILKEAE